MTAQAAPSESSPASRTPAFPGVSFTGRFEYAAYIEAHATRLADQDAYEAWRAAERPDLDAQGACAPCLRPCAFTASPRPGAGKTPGRLTCDCEDRLDVSERALLHFLQARIGLSAWTRLLHVGAPGGLRTRLRAMLPLLDAVPMPATRSQQTPAAHITLVPSLKTMPASFEALHATLVAGGSLVFACRFDPNASATGPDSAGVDTHGWDILDQLRRSGFTRSAANLYRSQTLGYPGAGNFLFAAEA